jgi:uncharacterized protein YjhX (UPF0386 family)
MIEKTSDLMFIGDNILTSAIEVTKNTKGHTWTVKCRCKDGEESKLIDRIVAINDELKKKFVD